MAVPSYTTDLTNIILDMGSTAGWTLISSGGGGASSLTAPETDYFIQGSNCISRNPFSTSIRGMVYTGGSAITLPSNAAIFIWAWAGVPNTLSTEASGGIQFLAGSASTNLKAYYVKGSDTYAYGGWFCTPFDPTLTADATIGTPTSSYSFFGVRWNVPSTGPTKGFPFAIDAMRYGRSLIITGGQSGNYANFSGVALVNDSQSNRWGLFQDNGGSFLQQGLFQIGSSGTLADFRDSDKNISINNIKKVASNFNGFEILNSSSNVELKNIQITSLGTVSRGYFNVVNDCTVSIDGCTFTNMDTFTFKSLTTIIDTTFRNTKKITQNSCTIENCLFDKPNDLAGINVNSINSISYCNFISAGTGHAIEGFSTAGDYTLNNLSFSGYASTNGSTGNEAIRVLATTGVVNLNINGGTTPTIRTNGATVNVIVPDITITINAQVSLLNAEVRVYDLNSTLPSLGTELSGVEVNPSSTYSFSTSANNLVRIQIMKTGYEEFGLNYTVPTVNSNLNITLTLDVNA